MHASTVTHDREAIRERLMSTQAEFHALLDGLTAADLRYPSGNPTWSVAAVLTHVVWSMELLPREVAAARQGKGMYNFPPLVRDWLNATVTRLAARGQTLQTLRQRYDAAFAVAVETLAGVGDDEFELGASFWSEGFRDIAGLYAGQVEHLREHGPDVRHGIPRLATAASATH